jgi:hypothetical protein
MDSASARSGPLPQVLKEALDQSDYLIVCCSQDSATSDWVRAEIAYFLSIGRSESILAAAVGPVDQWCLPEEIRARMGTERELLVGDLRGQVNAWDQATKRARRETALSLLAAILGHPDRQSLDKWRLKVGLMLMGTLLVLASASTIWRINHLRWLRTPTGSVQRAVDCLVSAVHSERVDEPGMIRACHALGVLGKTEAMLTVARSFGSEQFRHLATAAGYSMSDCDLASSSLELLDPNDATYWPEAFLYMAQSCSEPVPGAARAACSERRWIEALLETGQGLAASKLLLGADIPRAEAFPLELHAALLGNDGEFEFNGEFDRWWTAVDGSGYELANLLRDLDLAGLTFDLRLTPILESVTQLALEMLPEPTESWRLLQGFCARAACLSKDSPQRGFLELALLYGMDAPERYSGRAMARPWAERGLALQRLGDSIAADQAFERAQQCLLEPEPSSGTGGENRDVALAFCLAGRWPEAVDIALALPNVRMRALTAGDILSLWAKRRA